MTVVFDAAASFNTTKKIFNVTFQGTLANQLQPLLVATATTPPVIAEKTAGAGFNRQSAAEFPAGFFNPPVNPAFVRNGTIKFTVVGGGGAPERGDPVRLDRVPREWR